MKWMQSRTTMSERAMDDDDDNHDNDPVLTENDTRKKIISHTHTERETVALAPHPSLTDGVLLQLFVLVAHGVDWLD